MLQTARGNCNLDTVENKGELIKFCCQKVKLATMPNMVINHLSKCTFPTEAYR